MKRSLPFTTLCLLLLLAPSLMAQTGPGGVGTSDGSSTLEIWLRGQTGSFYTSSSTVASTTGDTVAQWRDRSGNDRHAVAAATPTDRRPLLRAGSDGLNGHSIVRFDGTNDYFRTGAVSPALAQPFTLFTISRKLGSATTANNIVDSRTSGTNTMTQGYWTNTTQARINAGSNLTLPVSQGDFTILRGVFDGTTSSLAANGGTAATGSIGTRNVDGFTIGASRNGDGFLNGEVAEVIAYSVVLNAAERCVVENHLSARYGVAIDGDHYASDTHIQDVIGIGRESDGATHTSSHAAGLVLEDDGFLADAGDYLFAGHAADTNHLVADDLPLEVSGRWNRIWYLEKTSTGSESGDVTLGFDFGDGGFSSSPGTIADYRLLYRSGASGSFTALTVSSSIEDDRILFDIPEANLADGYYTLGTTNGGDAPLPVELALFTVTLHSGHVSVAWATASERQNAGFILSRSEGTSGIYVPIASHHSDQRLVGAGTSSIRTDYSFTDPAELAPGLYHYRLVDVDLDGTIGSDPHHCSILIAPTTPIAGRLFFGEVQPNPVSAGASIVFEMREGGDLRFTLRDRLGREISATHIQTAAGRGKHLLDLSDLVPGVYFLTMQTGSFVRTRRVIVAR